MESKPMKFSVYFPRTGWRWALGLAGMAALAPHVHGQYDPDWDRNFRVGVLVGFNVKSSFRISGDALNVSGKPGIYNDGYVIPDPNNLDPNNDYTSNWGYNSDSQYNAAAKTLTLHKTTKFTPNSGSQTTKNDGPFLGFDMEYGGYPWRWERLRLGWTFGFGLLPIESKDNRTIQGKATVAAYDFETGTHVLFPPGGYQGSANGGPAIHSTEPENPTSEETPDAEIKGSRSLDVMLYSFRLGPTLFFDLNDKIGLSIGAGPAVGFVSGDYKYDETITIGTETASNKGGFSATDFLFGGYVNATVTYHATLNGDFYLSAQYMPLGSSTFSKGGREAKLDLSGAMCLSAGINWPF
jgi:hypothetical protein